MRLPSGSQGGTADGTRLRLPAALDGDVTERTHTARSTRRKPTRAAGLGITDERYAELLAEQDGHCAICPSTPKTRRLHVDHDHRTGRVRGLLCHRCNRGLPTWVTTGWLLDAAEYLARASVTVVDSPQFPQRAVEK